MDTKSDESSVKLDEKIKGRVKTFKLRSLRFNETTTREKLN